MVFTEEHKTLGAYKMVWVKRVEIVEEGETRAPIHHRAISPADDIQGESQETKDLCAEVHTQEIKDAYANRPTI